jgi:hypothetical protein
MELIHSTGALFRHQASDAISEEVQNTNLIKKLSSKQRRLERKNHLGAVGPYMFCSEHQHKASSYYWRRSDGNEVRTLPQGGHAGFRNVANIPKNVRPPPKSDFFSVQVM